MAKQTQELVITNGSDLPAEPPGRVITNYMTAPEVTARFADILGEAGAKKYIASVLTVVVNNDDLMKCDKKSIFISSMRAATLELSVDPIHRQAYLVPIKGKCEFWPGAKGLYDMAMRTGNYDWINFDAIYEGQEMIKDPLSGSGSIVGEKTSNKILGHFAALKFNRKIGGAMKIICWDIEQIEEHKKQYAKGYDHPKSGWKTSYFDMCNKTMLKQVLKKFALLDEVTTRNISQIEAGNALLHEDEDMGLGEDLELLEIEAPEIVDIPKAKKPPVEDKNGGMPKLKYTKADRPKAKDDWKALHDWARAYYSKEDVTHFANLAGDAQIAFDTIVAQLKKEEKKDGTK